jgi:hypothetical protein
MWRFQKLKIKKFAKSSKNLDNFIIFFLIMWGFFFKISKSSLHHTAQDFFLAK